MLSVSVPIVNDEENLGADNAGDHCDDPQIPHLIGIDARAPTQAHCNQQSDDKAQRGQDPIRGQEEISELSKSGEQASEDSVSAEGKPKKEQADPRGRIYWAVFEPVVRRLEACRGSLGISVWRNLAHRTGIFRVKPPVQLISVQLNGIQQHLLCRPAFKLDVKQCGW